MENIIIKAMVTTTSNKTDGKFKQDNPTKTAYLNIAKEDRQKAIDFGLQEYTSKTGSPFFIVKLPQQVSLYWKGITASPEKMSGGVEEPNFKTNPDFYLPMNIIKGENKGNTFYRLQAIQIENTTDIQTIEAENPFA